jgi:flagellar assembly protein FliH
MATIIKSDHRVLPSSPSLRQMAFDLNDLSGQAENYLDYVRQEAIKIVQRANQEAAAIQKRAEQAGRKAAEDAVERILNEKVAQQMKTLTPSLEKAVREIVDSKSAWQRHWEECVVSLACAIAGRLVRRELTAHPEITLDWIRETLELAGGAAEITLRLNPRDLESLRDEVGRLTATILPAAPVRLVGDSQISLGGCRVETEFGSIDKQLETQLERVQEELQG